MYFLLFTKNNWLLNIISKNGMACQRLSGLLLFPVCLSKLINDQTCTQKVLTNTVVDHKTEYSTQRLWLNTKEFYRYIKYIKF